MQAPPCEKRLRVFRDVLVLPTQGLQNFVADPRERLKRAIFQGGPDWPRFHLQVGVRHCRGWLPVPVDRRPRVDPQAEEASEQAGIWCGPVSPHFGHMISDFGARLIRSAYATDLPLVFSRRPNVADEPLPFFWGIIEALGIPPSRVLLVAAPTRFRTLRVFPQDERTPGRPPSAHYLDLIDARQSVSGAAVRQDIPILYVSRSRMLDGHLLGEAYLEKLLSEAGVMIMHPEEIPVSEQLTLYRRSRTIVFSEGSALYGLQLLGRLSAQVIVLVRRPGSRMAAACIAPRVRELAYWPVGEELLCPKIGNGRDLIDRALTVVDPERLCRWFRSIGVDISASWDGAAFKVAAETDAARWIRYVSQFDLHESFPATIARAFARIGLDVDRISAELSGGLEAAAHPLSRNPGYSVIPPSTNSVAPVT